ncbi:hypothetical protein BHU72_06440 [Desulfuribacillus stibiiarsenatis]|uniref:Uncharacterized protein n=1 Tax=Desulfuribacillus stibiiarsenatis TaxID=1390249 RepID=A0A1E5L599_9FIRM|nr:hypothetical protein [Desulfuribacillus stibiiarsenatis]OEH85238.1 hypothetical protein BHU72_06440 [Desulfuribacillus stibiiarsenatis]
MFQMLCGTLLTAVGTNALSNFSNIKVNVVHASPGRLRLQSPTWKNKQVADKLVETFGKHPLVMKVTASHITGSLLLEFHQPHITQEQFNSLMDSAVVGSVKGFKAKEADVMKVMRKTINHVDHFIKSKTLGISDIASIIVITLIVSSVVSIRGNNPGAGYRNLLWAYRMIKGEEARSKWLN